MKNFISVTEVRVGLNFGDSPIRVGRIAIRNRKIYFEFDREFLQRGLEISPLRLPLKPGLMSFDHNLFEGLPGVFNDSLPDGWGRLLFDRFARQQGVLPQQITPLDRLVHVGRQGLGALVFEPDHSHQNPADLVDLDWVAEQAEQVLKGSADEVLPELLDLNGSSAGARPKALIGVDPLRQRIIYGAAKLTNEFAPWIVKFSNTQDGLDAGAVEYVYALMAKQAGIAMPEVHLFSAKSSPGYFAVQRFDRAGKKRFHMHTACGLLHSDYRTPSLDYEDLVALTGALTRDVLEIEKLYQLAVFNVLAHNRDDHSKNFSFLMNETGEWQLSPAYDLTFSSGPGGEQSTMILGEGRNPTVDHLQRLGREAKISQKRVNEMIDQTKGALNEWESLAKANGVSVSNIDLIGKRLIRT